MKKNYLFKMFVSLKSPSQAVMGLIFLTIGFTVTLAQADGPNRVGLVVVHGDGEVIKQCIEFSEDKISGYGLLERSGLDLNADVASGMGAAICRIDNEGCSYPADDCFCECQGTPCIFWSYWRLKEGDWQFSQLGASNYNVSNGDVQGWVWGEGTINEGADPPPLIPFDEICEPPATDTPTPTHTPTSTPMPTDTPEPTDTPKPESTPIIDHFSADRTTINAGERVTLSWDLSKAEAVHLRYNGTEEGVVAPGSKIVTPSKTTVYTLVAVNDDGEEAIVELTITVNPVTMTTPPANQPTNQPSNQQTNHPTNTPVPPTATPAPGEPIISFSTASSTLPAGACTSLSWKVQNAAAVYLDGVEVEPTGSQAACPGQTQDFNLKVLYPGGERTAQLTLDVIDPISVPTDFPTVQIVANSSPEPALQSAQPSVEATLVSLNAAPTLASRPVKRNVSAEVQFKGGVWSTWTRLGIWGGLLGGWCVITFVILVAWGGFWWLNKRQIKR